MTDRGLTGKTVFIAGGAKNLGGLISVDLANQGVKAIAIHYNSPSSKAQAEETLKTVRAAGADAELFPGDLTAAQAMKTFFSNAITRFGRPDIAINTTGVVIKKPIAEITENDFDKSFAINAKAAFFFIQEAGNHVKDRGAILTLVTSLLGAYTGNYSIYAGSKAAVEHFTRAAAKELGSRGISVTAVAPGPMETPFFYGQESAESSAYHKSAADLSGFSKTGLTDPQDVVPLVRFLVSAGWWIDGQTILINGGYTTK